MFTNTPFFKEMISTFPFLFSPNMSKAQNKGWETKGAKSGMYTKPTQRHIMDGFESPLKNWNAHNYRALDQTTATHESTRDDLKQHVNLHSITSRNCLFSLLSIIDKILSSRFVFTQRFREDVWWFLRCDQLFLIINMNLIHMGAKISFIKRGRFFLIVRQSGLVSQWRQKQNLEFLEWF